MEASTDSVHQRIPLWQRHRAASGEAASARPSSRQATPGTSGGTAGAGSARATIRESLSSRIDGGRQRQPSSLGTATEAINVAKSRQRFYPLSDCAVTVILRIPSLRVVPPTLPSPGCPPGLY